MFPFATCPHLNICFIHAFTVASVGFGGVKFLGALAPSLSVHPLISRSLLCRTRRPSLECWAFWRMSKFNAPELCADVSMLSRFVAFDSVLRRRALSSREWISEFHHPHHRPTLPDVTGPPARFPIFLPTPPIALSGSRRSERQSVSGAGGPSGTVRPAPPAEAP